MTSTSLFAVVLACLVGFSSAYSESRWDSDSLWLDGMDNYEPNMDSVESNIERLNELSRTFNSIELDFGSGEVCRYPGGNCYQLRLQRVEGCTSHYSIHGLWPQWASKCGGGPKKVALEDFDRKFQKTMLKEWPTCKGDNHEWFWTHEWNKHGTCANAFGSMVDYFKAAVSLAQKYRHLCNRPDMDGLFRKVHSHNRNAEECGICFNRKLTKIIDCA